MLILLKYFQKIAEEGTDLHIFYDANITLVSKPDKDATENTIASYHHWKF